MVSYWFFGILLNFAVAILFMALVGFAELRTGVFGVLLSTSWLIPVPALFVRRLHDRNWTGWYGLVLLVPFAWDGIVGSGLSLPQPLAILLAIVSVGLFVPLFLDPTDGPNRFGPDPRLDPVTDALNQT